MEEGNWASHEITTVQVKESRMIKYFILIIIQRMH